MNTFQIIFTGIVQGVGFRYHVYHCANQQNITGYVENLSDGSVKAIVQINALSIDAFIDDLFKTSHKLIKIDKIKITPIKSPHTYSSFSIHY